MSLDSALNKDGNYYSEVFLKECKCIEKTVIRHIIDDLGSSFDNSGEPDEEQIKAEVNTFRESNFENVYFEVAISRKYFVGQTAGFENTFFEGPTLKKNIFFSNLIFNNLRERY